MGYSGRLLGVMVATALWMPATGMLHPANALAEETPLADTEAAARLAEADRLFQQGRQQFRTSQFREALQSWQQSLELYRDPTVQAAFPQGSRLGERNALGSLGIAYENLGQYQQAIDFHEQALAISREIGDRQGEGVSLGHLGIVYVQLGQIPQAIDFYEQSLAISREVGNLQGEGADLSNLGTAYYNLGRYQQAINFMEQALAVSREIGDRRVERSALDNLGTVYYGLSQYQQAIDFYEQSLAISREIGDLQGEGGALDSLGSVYNNLGQYQQAINFHEQALAISRGISDRLGEGINLSNLGHAYLNLGRYQQVIDFYEQALAISREIGNLPVEGNILGNLGVAHSTLGQYQQAIKFYEQQLEISREIGNRQQEGSALNRLGSASFLLGQYQQAIGFHEKALVISREIGDRRGEGQALANLGNTYLSLNQYQQAIDVHEKALVISREIGERAVEGGVLGNLGNAYFSLSQYQQAIDFHEQALAISREIDNRQGEGTDLNNLGIAHYYLKQFSASTNAFLEAIAIYDTLRTADLPDAEKIAFFDTYLLAYLNLQRSFVAQNETEQALVYGERGRARAFVELLATRITNNGDSNIASLESINSLDLAEIQRVAREQNATLVNYSVISDNLLFIWVVQPTGEIAFQEVDLAGQDLSELVSLVRATLGVRGNDRGDIFIAHGSESPEQQQAQRQQQLQQLHQLLIDPIASHLPTDPAQRVVIIPHQDLFLVPFAALVDGNGDYLIENHTILTAPSIQVLDLTYQQAIANNARRDRPTNSLIVGNPIMPSVWNPQTNQTQQLSNLPGAEREAIAIAKALDTDALLSGSASKATVMAQMPNARIIHLATHGLLEYGSPEDSGVLDVPGAIALAPTANEGGLLTAAEILQMNLNAELVVLSACDTGRGRITGDGVIGLSRAFVTAGVPSLMVSLWAVDDDATAEWMVTFYDQWQQTGDKAQAVRQAMLTTMENHPDPRLWAAFTLIGAAE